MELSATPSAVFDKSFIYASSGNANSSCSVPGDSSFDSANSLLKVSYKYQDYRSSPECVTTLNPRSTGHYSNRMTNFKFDLDVRSFSTAMAVNLGIIPTFALRSTSTQPSPLIHNGVNYVLAQFVDIRHTTMDRMYCLRNMSEVGLGQGVERLCVLSKGSTMFLPTFNHFGANIQTPEYCDCTTEIGFSKECNDFRLLIGLISYPYEPTSNPNELITHLTDLIDLVSGFSNYSEFNRAAYNASYYQANSFFSESEINQEQSKKPRQEDYDFCFLPEKNLSCSIFTFFEMDLLSYTVSEEQFQLQDGSCRDTVSMASSAEASPWENLKGIPPEKLTQNYFECIPTVFGTLLNALGVAIGNTSLAMMISLFAMLPFIYYVLIFLNHDVTTKEEYSSHKKKQAMEVFSTSLLRIRDNKVQGVRENGVLKLIFEELKDLADYENQQNSVPHTPPIGVGSLNLTELESIEPKTPESAVIHSFYLPNNNLSEKTVCDTDNDLKRFLSEISIPFQPCTNYSPTYSARNSKLLDFRKKILLKRQNSSPVPSEASTFTTELLVLNMGSGTLLENDFSETTSIEQILDKLQLALLSCLSTKENEKFLKIIQKYSAQLILLDFEEIGARNDNYLIFSRIANALCIHASLILNTDIQTIALSEGDQVAYNIGGKIISYKELTRTCLTPR